jgi:hypothetical protein
MATFFLGAMALFVIIMIYHDSDGVNDALIAESYLLYPDPPGELLLPGSRQPESIPDGCKDV